MKTKQQIRLIIKLWLLCKKKSRLIAKQHSEGIREYLMYEGNLEMTNQKEDYILMTYDRKRGNFALHLNGKCVKIAKRCSTIIIYLYENGTEQIKLITK